MGILKVNRAIMGRKQKKQFVFFRFYKMGGSRGIRIKIERGGIISLRYTQG